jgi:adenylate cyclase
MRTVSIRTSLLRSFLALVLGVSVTILVVMTFGARRAVRDLSEQLIDQSSDRADDAMTRFFGSIDGMLASSRAWWDAGVLGYAGRRDLERLNAVFMPLLDQNRQITSMMLAHGGGLEYLLFRDLRGGDRYEWYNRLVWADRGPEAGFEARWTRGLELYSEGPLPAEARDYDPRRRPFYTSPAPGKVHWTDPYYFFITRDAGMTASYKWKDPASGETRLVAFDLLLMDLSRFTAGLRPSPNGKVFVLHPDGSVLGLPADERWDTAERLRQTLRNPAELEGGATDADREAVLLTAAELGLPAVGRAVDVWSATRGRADVDHFQYRASDESWWGGFRPFEVGNQQLWIGVVVPERDFLAGAVSQRNRVMAVAGIALVIAIVMTGVLARRYSRPLEALAEQTARVRELQLTDQVSVQSPLREVAQLAYANAQMVTALESFSRYVPMKLVRQLLHRGEVARIGGREAELTILFTDIAGFTSVSEGMTPQALTHHMAEYFAAMLEELDREGATVDKFVGDAIVAFWGAPEPDADQARNAVAAVLRCSARLDELNEEWGQRGLPALPTRFGLCTGPAVVGNVGSPARLNYTVLGDTVNTAARLEAINKRYGTTVLATESVVRAAGPEFAWRRVDHVAVKGKSAAVAIYEPLGLAETVSDAARERAAGYEAALASYVEGRFADAAARLEPLVRGGDDPAAERLLALCRRYESEPLPPGWDGVTRFETK